MFTVSIELKDEVLGGLAALDAARRLGLAERTYLRPANTCSCAHDGAEGRRREVAVSEAFARRHTERGFDRLSNLLVFVPLAVVDVGNVLDTANEGGEHRVGLADISPDQAMLLVERTWRPMERLVA